jgi:small-conductance mechanosensitive channel
MECVMAEPAPFMIVEKLGDFNVLVRFFGWIDQRKADFAKVRGEAIRQVKLALDEAGVNMPEPIQTIRLEQDRATQSETTATPSLRVQGHEGRETKTVDVSPDTQLDDQIKEDLSATHEPNLLTEA